MQAHQGSILTWFEAQIKYVIMKRIIFSLIFLVTVIPAQETGARYLIITHDNFYNDILPLADWKHKKGMKAKVVRLSEIGSDSLSIKNYIVNAYNSWPTPPEYLLLVGAPNYIPFPVINGWHTDNYYTNIVETDIFNEILSGRLTVHNQTETQTVVNKILLYERTPETTDPTWFKKACLILRNDYDPGDTVYWNDVYHARNLMIAAGYDSVDTLASEYGNNANDVLQAVNAGRGFVMYRGQGLNSWWSPFNVNPHNTSNGAKLPLVMSFTCRCIGTSGTPAAAEEWFLTGTPTTPRGAAGYFATTTVGGGSITFRRSRVSRGFFSAIFTDSMTTFGQACEGGRQLVYATYNAAAEYRGFTTVGDPEMNIWTDTPCSLLVVHPPIVSMGIATFTVNVSRPDSRIPIHDAIVCVMGKSDSTTYAVDTTDTNGNAHFTVYPQLIDDSLYVTVTGRNIKPYEGGMLVVAPGSYVGYYASVIDDTLGGNSDGHVNPGEQINMPLWVKNYGTNDVFGVTGTLRTTDIYTTITDSVKSFGTIPANQICSTGTAGYEFSVMLSAPDAHVINFELICTDIDDSVWLSYFNERVGAPRMVFENSYVSGGNNNNVIDPGETDTLVIGIRNEGSTPLNNATAVLQSASTDITIIDSAGTYPPINPGITGTNDLDPFIVAADSNTPQSTVVEFDMIVNAEYYVDTISFSLIIGQKDYYIWNPDQTPEPGQKMDSILNALGYHGDLGAALASDLSIYRSVWVCAGVYPNAHRINSASPEATQLVAYLQDENGNMYLEGGDVWYYDPMGGGYNFCPLFGISATADGTSDMGPVVGQNGTFTQGMNFNYSGENSFMDHISPGSANAFLIFRDGNDNYDCGVAYDEGSYRTVGTSFELGLLTDGTNPSRRATLLDSIMHFFEITTGIKESTTYNGVAAVGFCAFPNPCRRMVSIKYNSDAASQLPAAGLVCLKIYDASGRLVNEFQENPSPGAGEQTILWYGEDRSGRRLPEGVYFLKFVAGDYVVTEKIVLLK